MGRSSVLAISGIIMSFIVPAETEARLRALVRNAFRRLRRSNTITLVIPEKDRLRLNHMYEACGVYLSSKISDDTHALHVTKADDDEEELAVTMGTDEDELIRDVHGGIHFTWIRTDYARRGNRRCLQLSIDKIHKDYALKVYLPYICRKAKELQASAKATVRLYTVKSRSDQNTKQWTYAVAKHPATIESMAMDPATKAELLRDLDLFVKGKDYYRRVGRVWKRGYLLYGPPGTGKSSLIAAMANYLKFDIFDLDLNAVGSNSNLRTLFLSIDNRSILVIEDIDCSVVSLKRADHFHQGDDDKITLSGLLNLIDGLWSCCGEERIIIFTTNHRESLDPALLRPGRMDVQLEMSYCTFPAFKMLASNYLCIDDHPLLSEIKGLLTEFPTTPAQIVGELMKNNRNVDAALNSLIRLLRNKGITHNV